jgi:hypothetical protein
MKQLICLGIALLLAVTPTLAQGGKRSGLGPCRQGALALIRMLDDNEDNAADYRHAYSAVVESCGPVAPAPAVAARKDTKTCRALALKMLDVMEDGKMNTQGFVRARNAFAQSCPPR